MIKEKSHENLVHFQADTYQNQDFAQWHKIVCEMMDDVQKTKFNLHNNLSFWPSKPRDKFHDINHFRGMFSIGSIYLSCKDMNSIRVADIDISFGYKNKPHISCLDNSPIRELLLWMSRDVVGPVDDMKDTEYKTVSEYVQYCIDVMHQRNELLIKILTSKNEQDA